LFIIAFFTISCNAQIKKAQTSYPTEKSGAFKSPDSATIIPGAYRIEAYLPIIQGKRVGIFANHTSMIENTHLVDSLQKLGINVVKIFGPEHGFRGKADAGEKVDTYIDKATGIKVTSLYGKKTKPSAEDLNDVDILLFDIQDVGARFYTFISSLQYFVESAFENHKPLIILDRPNPNGFYVDGPVLDTAYKSFIGMQPVPVVYGMTIGEYAMMIAGEHWLSAKANETQNFYRHAEASGDTPVHFLVIKCGNYTHKSKYVLPIKPSPNLPVSSILWYPSTCFFEGTILNEGRGTEYPFQLFGHPSLPKNLYSFTPRSTEGAKEPKLKDQQCYGWNLTNEEHPSNIQLKWLLEAYKLFPDKENFFIKSKSGSPKDYFFTKLAGNTELMQQIIDGKTEEEIKTTWQPKLQAFKEIRKKYLLYDDFE
jgi:uncharacterized protein YbbC (DUF1343 family)